MVDIRYDFNVEFVNHIVVAANLKEETKAELLDVSESDEEVGKLPKVAKENVDKKEALDDPEPIDEVQEAPKGAKQSK